MKQEIIIDTNGARGIVTRSEYHPTGFFARPEGREQVEIITTADGRKAKLMTDTFWHDNGDGTFEGLWVDSKLNTKLTARLA
jgi:hypothetical protein